MHKFGDIFIIISVGDYGSDTSINTIESIVALALYRNIYNNYKL